jgi:hypothetical protein
MVVNSLHVCALWTCVYLGCYGIIGDSSFHIVTCNPEEVGCMLINKAWFLLWGRLAYKSQIFIEFKTVKRTGSWALVAHTCNPGYLGGWDQEDWSLRPAQANSSPDPISRKMDRRCVSSCRAPALHHKALSSNPSPTKWRKKEGRKKGWKEGRKYGRKEGRTSKWHLFKFPLSRFIWIKILLPVHSVLLLVAYYCIDKCVIYIPWAVTSLLKVSEWTAPQIMPCSRLQEPSV